MIKKINYTCAHKGSSCRMFTEPPVTLNQIQGLQRSPCPWEAQAHCQHLPLLGAAMAQQTSVPLALHTPVEASSIMGCEAGGRWTPRGKMIGDSFSVD